MKTQEIPRNDWPAFLDGFTRRYEGWLADLEVFGPEIGSQMEEQEMPLEGITAELGNGKPDKIEIMLGAEPNDHITHTITAPLQVSVEKTDEVGWICRPVDKDHRKHSAGLTAISHSRRS